MTIQQLVTVLSALPDQDREVLADIANLPGLDRVYGAFVEGVSDDTDVYTITLEVSAP